MKRRQFLRTTAATTVSASAAGAGAAFAAENDAAAKADGAGEEFIIDIHQHVNYHGRQNDAMIAHQRTMRVSKSVLLPAGTEMTRSTTHNGKSNGLAARVFGTEAAARVATQYPDQFVYFANEIPDLETTKTELEKWLKRGARGIGEQKFNIDCDSREMRLIYDIAKEFQVPVLIHFQHNTYNLGFERFHKILESYPTVNFFGHAQTWWGNIDAKHVPTDLYPKSKVTPGGLTDRYLSDYPNMFGDMSAGSGLNALTRDLEHAAAFLHRHQDKLCYASDCADVEGQGDKCSGAKQRDVIRRLVPEPEVRAKIFASNARRVIGGLG